jgi:hypothetical protein
MDVVAITEDVVNTLVGLVMHTTWSANVVTSGIVALHVKKRHRASERLIYITKTKGINT